MTPSNYVPACPDDFIGTAHKLAKLLDGKAKTCLESGEPVKLLFYGSPGLGKTRLAEYFARLVAGHSTQIESVNGRKLNMTLLEQWHTANLYLPLYGKYSVKIVNELDTVAADKQDYCLSYLDELKPWTAFIGTSNLDLSQFSPRFQSRMQQFKLGCPSTSEIVGLLKRWLSKDSLLNQIAVGCGGNVRAALLDCQSFVDLQAS